jgi:hypothetical protein
MIQWNAYLVKRLTCSDAEKAGLPSFISGLLDIAQKARIEGITSLKNEIKNSKDPFLSYGLEIAAEGISEDILEDMLAVGLLTSDKTGYEFLKACIEAETVVSISSMEPVSLTLRRIAPYCGAEKALSLLESVETLYE